MPFAILFVVACGTSKPADPAPAKAGPPITVVTEAPAKVAAADAAAWTCPMHPEVVQDHAGDCPTCGMHLIPTDAVWTCPMHPEVLRGAAGDCPECGMHLVTREG